MASWMYASGQKGLSDGSIDLDTDTIKVALLDNTHSGSGAHDFFDDVSADEVSSSGYTAGGATLASKTLTATQADSWATARANSTAYAVGDLVRPATPNGFLYLCTAAGTSGGSPPTYPTTVGQTVADNTVTWLCVGRSVLVFDAADPTWSGVTFTARYAVVYKSTGTAGTSALLWLLDFGTDKSPAAETFTVQFAAVGIHRWLQ